MCFTSINDCLFSSLLPSNSIGSSSLAVFSATFSSSISIFSPLSVNGQYGQSLSKFTSEKFTLSQNQATNLPTSSKAQACKRAAILLCVIWVVSLLLGIPAGILPSLQRIVVYYVLALVIFIVPIYVRIYLVARRQARLIARQVGHLDRNSRSRGGKENVAAKTIGNVLTAFIICWLPLIVVPIVFRYIDGGPKVRKILKWVQTIGLCSSALNPVIYSLKTQIFKKDLRTIGRAIFRRRAWDEKPEIV